MSVEDQLLRRVRPLEGPRDLDPLLDRIGDARWVLLGEASHGTSEYYRWRTEITARLVAEKGFSFVAVEGDWPDCQRVNPYVRDGVGGRARDVLHAFSRWPTWMWANLEVVELVEWLRAYRIDAGRAVGFHGLDVYSLGDSLERVLGYLSENDGEALPDALAAFACFDLPRGDVEGYAWRTRFLSESCESEVVGLLTELRRQAGARDDDRFDAEQNALVARNAERYYRTMMRGGPESWNVRDRHMTETLERLMERYGPDARGIVWEHNTHVGDARFTDMAADGMINLGQLVRERHASEGVVLVGFGSYQGSVVAGPAWGAPWERMRVPPARPGSWEELLHRGVGGDGLLVFDGEEDRPRGHRAIGVVYHPDREAGNYVPTVVPRRYDAFLYLDRTEAVTPLHEVRPEDDGEVPETYPSGM